MRPGFHVSISLHTHRCLANSTFILLQPRLSCSWMVRTSAWRQRRTAACTRSVALCDRSTCWPAPNGCPGPADATSTSATGPCGASWSECLRSTAWVSCSAPAPTHCVGRGGGKPLYPPAPTKTWRVCSLTASISRAFVAEMTSAGKTWSPDKQIHVTDPDWL